MTTIIVMLVEFIESLTSPSCQGAMHIARKRPYSRGTSSMVSFVVAMNRVDVDLVVDFLDVNLGIYLVNIGFDVDLVEVDLVNIPFVVVLMSHRAHMLCNNVVVVILQRFAYATNGLVCKVWSLMINHARILSFEKVCRMH